MSEALRLHRAGDDLVDQADHRRLAGQVLQPFGVVFQRGGGGFRFGLRALFAWVEAFECCLQLDRDGDLQTDLPAGGGGDRGGSEVIQWIRRGQDDGIRVDRHRHGMGLAQEARRQVIGDQRRVERITARGGDRQVEQRRVGLGQPALGQQAELHQHKVEALAGFRRHAAGALDRPAVALPPRDQQVGERGHRLLGVDRLQRHLLCVGPV